MDKFVKKKYYYILLIDDMLICYLVTVNKLSNKSV